MSSNDFDIIEHWCNKYAEEKGQKPTKPDYLLKYANSKHHRANLSYGTVQKFFQTQGNLRLATSPSLNSTCSEFNPFSPTNSNTNSNPNHTKLKPSNSHSNLTKKATKTTIETRSRSHTMNDMELEDDMKQERVCFKSRDEAINELSEYLMECKIECNDSYGLGAVEKKLKDKNAKYVEEINKTFDDLEESLKKRRMQLLHKAKFELDENMLKLEKQKLKMNITYKTLKLTLEKCQSEEMKDKSNDNACIEQISHVISQIPSFDEITTYSDNENDNDISFDVNSIKLFISEIGNSHSNEQYKDASLTAKLDQNVLTQMYQKNGNVRRSNR